ncbi:MAG: hypothetical protein MUC96_26195 [Myxococcaceae bacterium]|jgi:hypothetical protein|nr:hypothetical protein [Myxococcaceae bacterium]
MILLALILAAEPAPMEPSLAGRWVDAERGVTSELSRQADGTWQGVAVASRVPGDVGKTTFSALRWDARGKRFVGTLHKPDDDQRVGVDLFVEGADALRGEAGVFIFRKTLRFSRAPRPDAGP